MLVFEGASANHRTVGGFLTRNSNSATMLRMDKVGERVLGQPVEQLEVREIGPGECYAGTLAVTGVYRRTEGGPILVRLSGGELALVGAAVTRVPLPATSVPDWLLPGACNRHTIAALQQATILTSSRGPTLPLVVTDGRPAVYIGRPGLWGNPFPHEGRKRGPSIALYRSWIEADPLRAQALEGLRGQVLQCFCMPQMCHGEALLALLAREQAETLP